MKTIEHMQIVVPAGWIAADVLEREGLSIEPLVMLEERDGEPIVRKLTMPEKIEYADRTDGEVFCGSDEEHEEMWLLLSERPEAPGRV